MTCLCHRYVMNTNTTSQSQETKRRYEVARGVWGGVGSRRNWCEDSGVGGYDQSTLDTCMEFSKNR